MRADRFELPLRIVVEGPVPGLAMALQRGSDERLAVQESAGAALAFELAVGVEGSLADGRPRLLGPFVQGPPNGRFVYLCVGRMAGQPDSPWGGRVKVPLSGLSRGLIETLPPGGCIEGRISGRGRKDGPALASVPILEPGWRVVAA